MKKTKHENTLTIEATVNRHRGALLIAIGGFLVFLYIRHKRQQAAAAAAQAAAAAAAQDPGTMDQNTYSKQFSQPAPAYLGSPFSGYGANAPNYPPPTQLQPGNGPASPTPPITFPNPAASSGSSTVAAATGGGAPTSGNTGTTNWSSLYEGQVGGNPDSLPKIPATQSERNQLMSAGWIEAAGNSALLPPQTPEFQQILNSIPPVSAATANMSISPNTAFSGNGYFVDSPYGPSWQWSN